MATKKVTKKATKKAIIPIPFYRSRQLFNSSSRLCGQTTTTKGPTGQTTSHPTQIETTLGHSPLLVQVETIKSPSYEREINSIGKRRPFNVKVLSSSVDD